MFTLWKVKDCYCIVSGETLMYPINVHKSFLYLYSCLKLFKVYKTHVYIVKRCSLISRLVRLCQEKRDFLAHTNSRVSDQHSQPGKHILYLLILPKLCKISQDPVSVSKDSHKTALLYKLFWVRAIRIKSVYTFP